MTSLTPAAAVRLLRADAGVVVGIEHVRLELRGGRWVTPLPDGRMALFADTSEAAQRLARERALLAVLADRVSFGVPCVEYASADDRLQVRRMVPGTAIGGSGRERAFAARAGGKRLADDLGKAFAELHGALSAGAAATLGIPAQLAVPDIDDLRRRLAGRRPDPAIAPALDAVETRYAAITRVDQPVLTHGDPWAGNFAVDLRSGALNGLFDFEDAALDDRHADLRYVHSFGDDFAERVIDAYARAAGVRLSPARVAGYHLLAAFEALAEAIQAGAPGQVARETRWVRHALATAPGRQLGLSLSPP